MSRMRWSRIFFISLPGCFIAAALLLFGGSAPPGSLQSWLQVERALPRYSRKAPSGDGTRVAYLLGGRQDSVERKIRTAARLYREGLIGKVILPHREGNTEYSPSLGRNLANDEWAEMKLREEGLANGDVEFVSVGPALLGTFAEAQRISELARARGWSQLVLVSSRHHTRRVWTTFSHLNGDSETDLYCYGTDEAPQLPELLLEAGKFLLYRYLVLPLDAISPATSRSPQDGRSSRSPVSPPTGSGRVSERR